jgi:hypothetical protein
VTLRRARVPLPCAPVNDAQQAPEPSPEVSQLVLLGQLDDAVALYAKQAEIEPEVARARLEELTDQQL